MAERPSGTVTFLFTDVEGSTGHWERHPAEMRPALAVHDEILRSVIEGAGGAVFATGGDGFAAAFGRADSAVAAAVEAQRALAGLNWPDGLRRHPRRGRVGRRQGHDPGRLAQRPDRRVPRQGRGLTADLSRVRLFHTSVSRATATWPGFSEPGFTGDFAEFLAQRFPTSTAADFAVLESGIPSEETYADQGLYWSTAHLPMLEYVAKTYKPDLLLVGTPTTDESQHQFLGLVSPTVPGGGPNPAYDDVDLNGVPDGRVAEREPQGAAPLRRHCAGGRQHVEGPERRRRNADTDRSGRLRPDRHQRLHVRRRRRLHDVRGRHGRCAAG
jgi:hypothetical protein